MTYDEAASLLQENKYLSGQKYHDSRKKQVDVIKELVVTPQDHPFFPEFINFYLQTGSYQEASVKAREIHKDDILYTVKCILEDIYDIKDNREMHVITDLKYVMHFIPVS